MTEIYPYPTGIVLTDDLFLMYGGLTGTSTAMQREMAYRTAEQQMTEYIGAYLYPTITTGVIPYESQIATFVTERGYVRSVLNLRVLNSHHEELYAISGTHSYSYIHNDTYGYVNVRDCVQRFSCMCNATGTPTYLEYAYESGLPSGVITQPPLLLGLTMAAQLTLNEMVFPFSNESTGDVGVVEYRSLNYSEKRKAWKNTAFGASAKSAKIAQLVDSTVRKARRAVVLR